MAKRKVRNITVCVTPQIYRQTRHLAAEYDTTVSTIVAWLLQRLPAALERTHFPKGGPKPSAKPAPLPCSPAPSLPASPTPSSTLTLTPTPSPTLTPTPGLTATPPGEIANPGCETVTPHLTKDFSVDCGEPADAATAPVQLCSGVQITHK